MARGLKTQRESRARDHAVKIIARDKTNILPQLFAVLGVVWGAYTNCKDTREEDSAISGTSQDVTPQQAKSCDAHEYSCFDKGCPTKAQKRTRQ